jgi:hypothetical protein
VRVGRARSVAGDVAAARALLAPGAVRWPSDQGSYAAGAGSALGSDAGTRGGCARSPAELARKHQRGRGVHHRSRQPPIQGTLLLPSDELSRHDPDSVDRAQRGLPSPSTRVRIPPLRYTGRNPALGLLARRCWRADLHVAGRASSAAGLGSPVRAARQRGSSIRGAGDRPRDRRLDRVRLTAGSRCTARTASAGLGTDSPGKADTRMLALPPVRARSKRLAVRLWRVV